MKPSIHYGLFPHFNKLAARTLLVICGSLLLLSASLYAQGLVRVQTRSGRTVEALPGHVLVKYKEGRSAIGKAGVMRGFGVSSQRVIPSIGVEVLPVPAGETIQTFLQKLQDNPEVEFAEPNGVMRALTAPNDPLYNSQYALQSSYINVEGAWDVTQGSNTIVVAVVDTGVTLTHQDLDDNLWINPNPSGNSGLHGTTILIDWTGNGACGDPPPDPSLGPEQCASSDPTDDNSTGNSYHGTRVSGIIAAETNNGLNIAGIARNSRIMGVKALNSVGAGSYEAIAEAITYAADNGASVINLSLGGGVDSSGAVQTAVDYAINTKNAVVVAAAGNDGNSNPINFPASIPAVIAVGATNVANTIASFSCTGPEIDLVAPGMDIYSLRPTNTADTASGTSFSAPMVSGVAALIRAINPTMSVSDVTRYLTFTATDLGSSGFDNTYGFGRLNAALAVQSANAGTIFISNPASPGETFPYPNPFRPGAGQNVTIALPSALGTQSLEIFILNTAGERIKTLTGTNVWDGKNDDGNYVASGLYFYFATTSQGEAKGKLTVLK